MSTYINQKYFMNPKNEKKPTPKLKMLTNWNQLKTDSSEDSNNIDIKEFRNSSYFNPKKTDLEVLFPIINFIPKVSSLNQKNNLNNLNNFKNQQNKENSKNFPLSQNKNLLKKRNKKNKNNKGGQRKNNKRNKSNISKNNSRSNSFIDISSQRSKSSKYDSKKTQFIKGQISQEKIPEIYEDDVLDSSSGEENRNNNFNSIAKNNNNIFNKNNNFDKFEKLNKLISQKLNELEPDEDEEQKETIEQQLEGFDLMAVDFKSLFRDKEYKSRYFKDLIANIKIVYFDRNIRPLHAVIVFAGKDGSVSKEGKKLFAGAYFEQEFVQFCEKKLRENTQVKVELLMDFADMNKKNYSGWMEFNPNLLIDFYILVNIFE